MLMFMLIIIILLIVLIFNANIAIGFVFGFPRLSSNSPKISYHHYHHNYHHHNNIHKNMPYHHHDVYTLFPSSSLLLSSSSSSLYSSTLLLCKSSMDSFPGEYIDRLLANKRYEMNALLRKHQPNYNINNGNNNGDNNKVVVDDPLIMRMSFLANKCNYRVTHAVKRMIAHNNTHNNHNNNHNHHNYGAIGNDNDSIANDEIDDVGHKDGTANKYMNNYMNNYDNNMLLSSPSVIIDMKRKSPTKYNKHAIINANSHNHNDDKGIDNVDVVDNNDNIVNYDKAGDFALMLSQSNVDVIMISIDELYYGGQLNDLKDSIKALRKELTHPPACIAKDIIIHPVQIAQALECGADGVLLIAAVVGPDLTTLLDACTIMGTEAIVEVHTPQELDFALEAGATIFLINRWDRVSGHFYREQAKGLISKIPGNCVTIAAGNIGDLHEIAELAALGFDGIVIGRNLPQIADLKEFVDKVHNFHR